VVKIVAELDCHVHYYEGDKELLKTTIDNSPYASKYMCYRSVNTELLMTEKDLDKNVRYFMIPFVLKETNIEKANRGLFNFSDGKNEIIQFPLLGDSIEDYEHFHNFGGMKEHFLIHEREKYEERVRYYEYLANKCKILLLHCKDSGRLEYIKKLRLEFPSMYIQVAHLGVNRKDIWETMNLLKEFSGDDHVYYDISTVYDYDFIIESFPIVKNQILYGTDIPYVKIEDIERQRKFYMSNKNILDCMNVNARRLLSVINYV